jgi:hypothetical protein
MSKEKLRKALDEVCKTCSCKGNNNYCLLLQWFISTHGDDPRFVIQEFCIEKFKYELGADQQRAVDFEEARLLWVEMGLAKKFAENYDVENPFKLPIEQFFRLIYPAKN